MLPTTFDHLFANLENTHNYNTEIKQITVSIFTNLIYFN